MSLFVIPNPDGSIKSTHYCADRNDGLQSPDAIFYTGDRVSDLTHWVSDGEIVAKTSAGITVDTLSIAADGVDAATFSNIPAGCVFDLGDAGTVTVNDGSLEITAALVGSYRVRLIGPPQYLLEEWEVIAS